MTSHGAPSRARVLDFTFPPKITSVAWDILC